MSPSSEDDDTHTLSDYLSDTDTPRKRRWTAEANKPIRKSREVLGTQIMLRLKGDLLWKITNIYASSHGSE